MLTRLLALLFISSFAFAFVEGEVQLTHGKTFYKKIEPQPGAPYLVFVHGGTVSCSHGSFDEYMTALSTQGKNVLCFDAYGAGKSGHWLEREIFSQSDMEEQLKELMDKLPETRDKQNIVFGSSAGACTTARYASSNPERVSKVGFISPAINVTETKSIRDKFGIWLFRQFPSSETFHDLLKKKMRTRTKEVVQECPQMVQQYIGQVIDEAVEDRQFVNNFYRKVIGDVFADCTEAFEKTVSQETPFFAAAGGQDSEVPLDQFRDVFREKLEKGDTYLEFMEAGHGLQCRESQRLIQEIAKFMDQQKPLRLRQPASTSASTGGH